MEFTKQEKDDILCGLYRDMDFWQVERYKSIESSFINCATVRIDRDRKLIEKIRKM
jgi:hypothetical protein